MLINNYTKEAIQLDVNGVKLVLLPGNRRIPEESLPQKLINELVLDKVEGLKILEEYPSVTVKAL